MNTLSITAFRVILALIFLILLVGQAVLIPVFAQQVAEAFPEVASLAPPYVILCIAALACIQVALIAVWALLSRVRARAIFNASAFHWVDVIIGAAVLATLIALGMAVHLLGVLQLGGPGVVVGLGSAMIGGVGFVLLMTVMRGLLHQAATLQDELAEVV